MTLGEFRPRALPAEVAVRRRDQSTQLLRFDQVTLVVGVKADCDGCRPFYLDELSELGPLRVVPVARVDAPEFDAAVRPVLVDPDLMDLLSIRWPPLCVVVAPDPPRVAMEIVPFGVAQVASELARAGWL